MKKSSRFVNIKTLMHFQEIFKIRESLTDCDTFDASNDTLTPTTDYLIHSAYLLDSL